MQFPKPLVSGTLIKRYKRFLADVRLDDGTVVTAHCANSGSMMGVAPAGAPVWLSPSPNPKAKLPYRWELIEIDGALVGINTSRPNHIAEEAIAAGQVPELAGYGSIRREVRYGENSRIDLLLEDPGRCYVEIKNVTLRRDGQAQFPDAVTARGTKHLRELAACVADGDRAVMLYVVQRGDCDRFRLADDIDPAYAAGFAEARAAGVEALCYACSVTPAGVAIDRPLPIDMGKA